MSLRRRDLKEVERQRREAIEREAAANWQRETRRIAHCPACKADVSAYQRGEGPIWCPWCDGIKEATK